MPYPTVPDLKAFEPEQVPNLMAGGLYDQQLTAIENYLKSLGAYIDGTVLAAAQAAQETASAAQSAASQATETANAAQETASAAQNTANANAAAIGTWTTDHSGSTISQAVTSTTQTANTAASNASTALTWTQNASSVSANMPTKINAAGNGTDTVAAQLFGSDGTEGTLLDKLALLLSNLMLAAPNGDTTKLLGYLADNTADLTTATAQPRSSAALTWASEQGGSGGAMPDNVVLYDASPGLKSSLYVMSGEDRQDIDTINMTADDASLQVGPGAFNEGGATRITPKSLFISSTSPGETWGVDVSKAATPLTSEQLASAEVVHDPVNVTGTVRVSLP